VLCIHTKPKKKVVDKYFSERTQRSTGYVPHVQLVVVSYEGTTLEESFHGAAKKRQRLLKST